MWGGGTFRAHAWPDSWVISLPLVKNVLMTTATRYQYMKYMYLILYLCLMWIVSYSSNQTRGHNLHVALLCAVTSAGCEEDEVHVSALWGENMCDQG